MPGVKALLARLGGFAKKRFGQNFLTDDADLLFIAEAVRAQAGETVLEIGPGLGALTEALLARGFEVVAVEKDRTLVTHLQEYLKDRPLRVYSADILAFDPVRDGGIQGPFCVAGNIPYNITSPILSWLVAQRARVREAVLMVQSEVAERLTGKPGHENWGAVSVSLGAYADITWLRKVPRQHFYPAPKVDSAVIRLEFLPEPRVPEKDRALFHTIVARAFQKRRKTLLNALEDPFAGRDKASLSRVLEACPIDPKRRPETLTVADWVLLARQLGK